MCRRQKSKKGMNECVKALVCHEADMSRYHSRFYCIHPQYLKDTGCIVGCQGSWSLIVSMTTTGVSLPCSAWSMAASRKDWATLRVSCFCLFGRPDRTKDPIQSFRKRVYCRGQKSNYSLMELNILIGSVGCYTNIIIYIY